MARPPANAAASSRATASRNTAAVRGRRRSSHSRTGSRHGELTIGQQPGEHHAQQHVVGRADLHGDDGAQPARQVRQPGLPSATARSGRPAAPADWPRPRRSADGTARLRPRWRRRRPPRFRRVPAAQAGHAATGPPTAPRPTARPKHAADGSCRSRPTAPAGRQASPPCGSATPAPLGSMAPPRNRRQQIRAGAQRATAVALLGACAARLSRAADRNSSALRTPRPRSGRGRHAQRAG